MGPAKDGSLARGQRGLQVFRPSISTSRCTGRLPCRSRFTSTTSQEANRNQSRVTCRRRRAELVPEH